MNVVVNKFQRMRATVQIWFNPWEKYSKFVCVKTSGDLAFKNSKIATKSSGSNPVTDLRFELNFISRYIFIVFFCF